MNTLEVLIAARVEVDRGWYQGALHDPSTGSVCAIGACYRAVGDTFGSSFTLDDAAVDAAEDARCVLEGALGGEHVPSFNDRQSTTKADVLSLFDRAINAEAQKVTPNPDPAHSYPVAA